MTVMTMLAREVTLLSLDSRETRINPGYQRNGSNVKVAKLGFSIMAWFLVFIASQGKKVRNVDGVANDGLCKPDMHDIIIT